MNIFYDSHQEVLKQFLKDGVAFLLIGGYAVIAHGHRRTTGDMDLWLQPTNENKEKFIAALAALNYDPEQLEELRHMDFAERLVFSLGQVPEKIDFLTRINLASFDEADSRKVVHDFDGLMIPVIHLNDLVLSKTNTGRPKDAADVDALQKIKARQEWWDESSKKGPV